MRCAMKKAAVPSVLVAVVLLAIGVIAEAQEPKKVPRIGVIFPAFSSVSAPSWRCSEKDFMISATLREKTSSLKIDTQMEKKIVFLPLRRNWSISRLI